MNAAGPWKKTADELPPVGKQVLWKLPGEGFVAGFIVGSDSPYAKRYLGAVYPWNVYPQDYPYWAEVIDP